MVIEEIFMGDGFSVEPLASAIRDAVVEGDVRVDQIDWSRGPAPNSEVRKEIIRALQDDLYIDLQEKNQILSKAKDEYQFVSALVDDLRENQPLFARLRSVKNLLDKETCCWFGLSSF